MKGIFLKKILRMIVAFFAGWGIGVTLFTIAFSALPMTAKLAWNAPTTTVDGQLLNADTALTNYTLYCGRSPSVYTITKPTGSLATEYRVIDIPLTGGMWYCVVTASNKYGESGHSNEKGFDLDIIAPGAVINLSK